MTNENKIELVRVNINLPSHLVSKVKEYANNLGINTTSAYIVLLNQALEQKSMLENIPLMVDAYNQIKNLNLLNQTDDE